MGIGHGSKPGSMAVTSAALAARACGQCMLICDLRFNEMDRLARPQLPAYPTGEREANPRSDIAVEGLVRWTACWAIFSTPNQDLASTTRCHCLRASGITRQLPHKNSPL